MDNLKTLRYEIDQIDEQLVDLFERRMELVEKIANYKHKNNLQIFDGNREQEVLDKNLGFVRNQKYKNAVEQFIQKILKISKELQLTIMRRD